MSRVSYLSNENPEKKNFKKISKNFQFFFFFKIFQKNFKFFFFRMFITWIRNHWHGGVYIPYGKSRLRGFEKIYVGRLFSGYLKLGVLGAWMTFKKAEMAKTLQNGLSMIEMNTLNHNWWDFVILSGLTLHQVQKKLLLSKKWKSYYAGKIRFYI